MEYIHINLAVVQQNISNCVNCTHGTQCSNWLFATRARGKKFNFKKSSLTIFQK